MANKNQLTTDDSSISELGGLERAAIFLLALGESDAAEILRHLGPKEVQELGLAMASLTKVSTVEMHDVMKAFVDTIKYQTSLGVDSDEYIRKVLTNALGPDKAAGIIDRILLGKNSKGLEQLKWMDPRAVTELIRYEHPQIIAIVLSFLENDQAAEVLSGFTGRLRSDIVMRIATLEGIQPAALQELDDILEKQFAGNANALQSSAFGGVKTAANILNFVEGSIESEIMEHMLEADEDLAQEVQDNMFVFDNLIEVDDRGIQTLLREVSTDQLLLALRAADEMLKEKVFRNMSKRASEMLRDDLEAAAPVKLSEVEGAQKEILAIARRMADAGELALGGSGGDEFV